MKPFTRLISLETEYAMRYQATSREDRRPTDGALFRAVIAALGKEV